MTGIVEHYNISPNTWYKKEGIWETYRDNTDSFTFAGRGRPDRFSETEKEAIFLATDLQTLADGGEKPGAPRVLQLVDLIAPPGGSGKTITKRTVDKLFKKSTTHGKGKPKRVSPAKLAAYTEAQMYSFFRDKNQNIFKFSADELKEIKETKNFQDLPKSILRKKPGIEGFVSLDERSCQLKNNEAQDVYSIPSHVEQLTKLGCKVTSITFSAVNYKTKHTKILPILMIVPTESISVGNLKELIPDKVGFRFSASGGTTQELWPEILEFALEKITEEWKDADLHQWLMSTDLPSVHQSLEATKMVQVKGLAWMVTAVEGTGYCQREDEEHIHNKIATKYKELAEAQQKLTGKTLLISEVVELTVLAYQSVSDYAVRLATQKVGEPAPGDTYMDVRKAQAKIMKDKVVQPASFEEDTTSSVLDRYGTSEKVVALMQDIVDLGHQKQETAKNAKARRETHKKNRVKLNPTRIINTKELVDAWEKVSAEATHSCNCLENHKKCNKQ